MLTSTVPATAAMGDLQNDTVLLYRVAGDRATPENWQYKSSESTKSVPYKYTMVYPLTGPVVGQIL